MQSAQEMLFNANRIEKIFANNLKDVEELKIDIYIDVNEVNIFEEKYEFYF